MKPLTKEDLNICKIKLLERKSDILNRLTDVQTTLRSMSNEGRTGDEADKSAGIISENEILTRQAMLQHTLKEIEWALHKIETGRYGICEETEEPIEPKRLLAIPWTRLSIEGAEIRESLEKHYAS